MSSEKTSRAIAAITESRPPATDRFTYLTILESHLSPEILPALDGILQDAELTQEIGWDLVFNLVTLPGSEACLATIARLGNPREVILKVLEALELLQQDEGYQSENSDADADAAGATPTADVSTTHRSSSPSSACSTYCTSASRRSDQVGFCCRRYKLSTAPTSPIKR